jgi:hypothetical protein
VTPGTPTGLLVGGYRYHAADANTVSCRPAGTTTVAAPSLLTVRTKPSTTARRPLSAFLWAVDRLHPSERGHRLIACRFHDLLTGAGLPAGPRPDPEPSSPPPARLAEIGWMATKGTAWVLRRSTDLVPGLLAMAIREWRSGEQAPSATMERVVAGPRARQGR